VHGRGVYKDCWFWVDVLILTIFSVFLAHLVINKFSTKISDDLDLTFLFLRNFLQITRFLIYMCKTAIHIFRRKKVKEIILDDIGLDVDLDCGSQSDSNSDKNVAVELTKNIFLDELDFCDFEKNSGDVSLSLDQNECFWKGFEEKGGVESGEKSTKSSDEKEKSHELFVNVTCDSENGANLDENEPDSGRRTNDSILGDD